MRRDGRRRENVLRHSGESRVTPPPAQSAQGAFFVCCPDRNIRLSSVLTAVAALFKHSVRKSDTIHPSPANRLQTVPQRFVDVALTDAATAMPTVAHDIRLGHPITSPYRAPRGTCSVHGSAIPIAAADALRERLASHNGPLHGRVTHAQCLSWSRSRKSKKRNASSTTC